jgi:hypothetical protein
LRLEALALLPQPLELLLTPGHDLSLWDRREGSEGISALFLTSILL